MPEEKTLEPPVQEFSFSPELRIAELEREVKVLKQIVKKQQVQIEWFKRPFSEVLEEAAKELGEELKKENKSFHQ